MQRSRSRSIQLHPTRACNLRCRHCYSLSGPDQRGALDPAVIDALLVDGRRQGFELLSISGGEPLLWRDLETTLGWARALGYQTSLTTNATLATPGRLDGLRGLVDVVGISIDGPGPEHDAMRGDATAFARMLRGAEAIQASGVACGFVFTLTQHNLHQLPEVVAQAARLGLGFVQIHPLEAEGEARAELSGAVPDQGELVAAAWLMGRLSEAEASRGVRLRLDAIDLASILAEPARVNAEPAPAPDPAAPLAELLDAVVVEPDGVVVPLCYGFSRALGLGDLRREGFDGLARRWIARCWPTYTALCRQTLDDLRRSGEVMVNWTERLREAAARQALVPPSAERTAAPSPASS